MNELSAADAGRIIAALEHFAEDHPEADLLAALADQVANCKVLLDCDPADRPTAQPARHMSTGARA